MVNKISKVKNNYINPDEMLGEYDDCLKNNVCSYKLLNYFKLIANKYSKSRNISFSSNHDRNVCVNYAVTEAWQKWNKFDKTKSDNIFAFFTQMIKNDMLIMHERLYRRSRLDISLDSIFNGNSN